MRFEQFRNNFKQGLKTAEAVYRIWEVKGNKTIADYRAQNWFKCFKDGDLSFEMKYRIVSVFDYDALKYKIKRELTTSTEKNSEKIGSSKDNTCRS